MIVNFNPKTMGKLHQQIKEDVLFVEDLDTKLMNVIHVDQLEIKVTDLVMAVVAPKNSVTTIIHDTEIRIKVQLDSNLTTEILKISKEITVVEIIDKAKDRQLSTNKYTYHMLVKL